MVNLPEKTTLRPAMKMAELVDLDYALLSVFSRMGVPLGFGEASVEEVCTQTGIPTEEFLLICRIYANEAFVPSPEDLARAGVPGLVAYLRKSHSYYMDVALQVLEQALERMIAPCESRSQRIFRTFFKDYREELARHFAFEEEKVFPYLESGAAGDFRAEEFEDTHENVEEKLGDLKSLIVKYLPKDCDQYQANRTVRLLLLLGHDFQKHILLEDSLVASLLGCSARTVLESLQSSVPAEDDVLSQREKEILVCVAKGLLNKEIADQCNLSIHTVITHRKNITRKTGIKSVAGLTVYALLNNLIDINVIE